MSAEPAPQSPYITPATSLLELAEQVSTAALSISNHLRSKSANEPNFGPTSKGLPKDPEIEQARKSLLVASKALTTLATDPLTHLREAILSFSDACALKVVVEWKVAHVLSTDGAPMHISEIATKTSADEHRLLCAMRLLANCYVFTEVNPKVFAHNFSSIHLTERPTECLVGYWYDKSPRFDTYNMGTALSESMRKHGSSIKANDTAFNIALNTDKTIFEYLGDHPHLYERFNECMRPMSTGSYARLRTVFPWKSLGDSLLIDIGGGNGHVTHQIAEEAPRLRVMIQDLEQPVSEARGSCPEHLKSRFDFRVHSFFQTQPVEADVYFLRLVLHFLNDDACVKLIRNIVPAMKPGSRILVAESVFPVPEALPNPLHKYVVNMSWIVVAMANAKERTFEEFERIFHMADERFRVKQWGESGGGGPASEILEATLHGEIVPKSQTDALIFQKSLHIGKVHGIQHWRKSS